jgi:prophage regulatory protein
MEQDALASEIRFIRLKEVMSICGMSRSSVYGAIKKGQFPSPVKLSARSIAWLKSDVIAWVESRVKATRDKVADQRVSV